MNVTFCTCWLAGKLRGDWPKLKWNDTASPNFFSDQVFDWQVAHHPLGVVYVHFLPRSFHSNSALFSWLLKINTTQLERFSNDCRKTKTKAILLLWPITAGANSAMNQSQFLAVTCNSPKAKEKSHVYGGIGFSFASHWLKNCRKSFKPITKCSNRNHVITFDSHLNTALQSQLQFAS